MITATKEFSKRKKAKDQAGPAAAVAIDLVAPGPAERKTVPIDQVEARLDNPRTTIAELESLAQSIRDVGILQPLVVRPKPGYRAPIRYEIVAGERRYRAARIAGLKEIPVAVYQLDDKQLRLLRALENGQREDLDPIEEAREYRSILDAGDYAGVTELARAVGKSQPHVSNRLRLLDLPESFQKRVISREMSPSHAREVATYKDHPKLLKAIEKEWEDRNKWGDVDPSVDQWRDMIDDAVGGATRPMDGTTWTGSPDHRSIPVFKPTAEQLSKLEVIEVQRGKDKTERRAMNVELWEKLQMAHGQARAAKGKKGQEKADGKPAAAAATKPLSEAEKKRLEEEERKKAAERDQVFRSRLWNWYVDWLRLLLARALRQDDITIEDQLRLSLYFAASHNTWESQGDLSRRSETLEEVLKAMGVRVKRSGFWQKLDVWAGLTTTGNPLSLVADCLADWFYHEKDGPRCPILADDVVAIASFLGVDPEREWLADQAGSLSEEFWDLHTKDQLQELGTELGLDLPSGAKKTDLVAAFLAKVPGPDDKEAGLPYPKELKKIKARK